MSKLSLFVQVFVCRQVQANRPCLRAESWGKGELFLGFYHYVPPFQIGLFMEISNPFNLRTHIVLYEGDALASLHVQPRSHSKMALVGRKLVPSSGIPSLICCECFCRFTSFSSFKVVRYRPTDGQNRPMKGLTCSSYVASEIFYIYSSPWRFADGTKPCFYMCCSIILPRKVNRKFAFVFFYFPSC